VKDPRVNVTGRETWREWRARRGVADFNRNVHDLEQDDVWPKFSRIRKKVS